MADVETTSNVPQILPVKLGPITPAELRLLLQYEPEAGTLFWLPRSEESFVTILAARTWNARYANKPAFTSLNGPGYRVGKIYDHLYLAHRVIWALVQGEWPTNQIDHVNGDRSNNRLANLREVSHAENQRNQKRPSNNTTGVMGVYVAKASGKYMALIEVDGRSKYLGLFHTIKAATAARKAAETQYGFHVNHGR